MKYDGSSWQTVGTAGFSPGANGNISLAFSGTTPYVAFMDGSNGNKATVMKYDGSNWIGLGAASFSAGAATYLSMAIDSSTPYVAYRDGGNGDKATVMKYDGNNWVSLGGAGFTTDSAAYLSMAIDSSTPYVAYSDVANNFKTTVARFYDPTVPVVSSSAITGNANGLSTASGNLIKAPATGYGTPSNTSPLTSILVIGAVTSTGIGLTLIYCGKGTDRRASVVK
jgi:hypothetical protein